MAYLPSDAEQEELLSDLAEIISRRGSGAFLTSPIVMPHPRFLPDAWQGDLASAQILLRRLMLYAGLAHGRARLGEAALLLHGPRVQRGDSA